MSDNDLVEIISFKTSPQIEKALAQQMSTLPSLAFEQQFAAGWSCFGLIICCYSKTSKTEKAEDKKED